MRNELEEILLDCITHFEYINNKYGRVEDNTNLTTRIKKYIKQPPPKSAEDVAYDIRDLWCDYYKTLDLDFYNALNGTIGRIQQYATQPNGNLLTEQQFIQRFKEKGFELYKTEEIENKVREEWISVKDRFPEKSNSLLLWSDFGGVLLGFYNGDSFFETYNGETSNITHWMPLPNPPTE